MVDKIDIQNDLLSLGLTIEESLVYKEILVLDALSILALSRKVNIPRSTVYRICESLVKKGFANWLVSNNGRLIKATDVNSLGFVKEEYLSMAKKVDETISHLEQYTEGFLSSQTKTEVKYYQGKEGIKQVIWNTLKAENEIIGYSEFGRVAIVGEEFYNSYVKEFKLRGLKDRVLANEDARSYINKYVVNNLHQVTLDNIREITKEMYYVSGDHSIYNDTYSILNWNQGEVVGVEITNKELTKLHKSIFNILWNIAKPIS